MNIKRVRAIYYSATGTTQKVVETLAKTMAEALMAHFRCSQAAALPGSNIWKTRIPNI